MDQRHVRPPVTVPQPDPRVGDELAQIVDTSNFRNTLRL